jgi:hypothetical protein
MPCEYNSNEPGEKDKETHCQFTEITDEECVSFDGKYWCPFHLPINGQKNWDSEYLDRVKQEIISRILNSKAGETVNLSGVKIRGPFLLKKGGANVLSRNHVPGNIDLTNADFSGKISFETTSFDGEFRITNTKFHQHSNFAMVDFRQFTDFSCLVFEKGVNFTDSVFRQ